MEERLVVHQVTDVEVPPRRALHEGGRTSQIRKATDEHHILVWLPGAFLGRSYRKVPIRQSGTTLETRVRTPFWTMGEDTLLCGVRTPSRQPG